LDKREHSEINNDTSKTGVVYYYSPHNDRLQSFGEIQKYLDEQKYNGNLTLDHFTFRLLPTGINDTSKEVIKEVSEKSNKVIITIINMYY